MDNKTESSLSYISQQCDKQILSKLRRLKIQETILTQNLVKTEDKSIYEDSQGNFPTFGSRRSNLDSNNPVVKVKDSYRYVKNLFDEINTQTHSQELLADIDIKEMKNKVLEFETKLKSLKFALNSELNSLKSLEQELIHQLNDQPKETIKLKIHRKASSAKYNDIVPSPVRTFMMSPFKCSEVQEFQDFMKTSGNRYGGWNEYNHNLFVKIWLRLFGTNFNVEWMNEDNFLLSKEYEIFINDLLPKLQGISESDIKSHTKWHIKYMYLKNKQQEAIERWKWSKRSMRDIDTEVGRLEEAKINSRLSLSDADNMSREDYSTTKNKIRKEINLRSHFTDGKKRFTKQDKKELNFSTLMKPTAQWLNRSYVDMESCTSTMNYSVENIEKLGIPNWRLGLK